MNLSERSVEILKNYSGINPSVQFEQGDVLRTISPNKTIMSKAKLDSSVEGTFAIYDLSRFLGLLSTFESPDFEIGEKMLGISSGKTKSYYTFADPENIITPPKKEINIGDADVSFTMTEESYNQVMRAIGIMALPEFLVVGSEGKVYLQGADTKKATNDTYSIEVGECDKDFTAVFRTENMKLLPGDYEVNISSAGISHFKGEDIEYWVSIEANSTF